MITTKDVQILTGRSVELVCFARFSAYIHLQDQIQLTVEAEFDHVLGDSQERQVTTFPTHWSSLMRLLECSIVSATVESDGCLHLTFSNGDGLKIRKQPEFESYHLRIGATELHA